MTEIEINLKEHSVYFDYLAAIAKKYKEDTILYFSREGSCLFDGRVLISYDKPFPTSFGVPFKLFIKAVSMFGDCDVSLCVLPMKVVLRNKKRKVDVALDTSAPMYPIPPYDKGRAVTEDVEGLLPLFRVFGSTASENDKIVAYTHFTGKHIYSYSDQISYKSERTYPFEGFLYKGFTHLIENLCSLSGVYCDEERFVFWNDFGITLYLPNAIDFFKEMSNDLQEAMGSLFEKEAEKFTYSGVKEVSANLKSLSTAKDDAVTVELTAKEAIVTFAGTSITYREKFKVTDAPTCSFRIRVDGFKGLLGHNECWIDKSVKFLRQKEADLCTKIISIEVKK